MVKDWMVLLKDGEHILYSDCSVSVGTGGEVVIMLDGVVTGIFSLANIVGIVEA